MFRQKSKICLFLCLVLFFSCKKKVFIELDEKEIMTIRENSFVYSQRQVGEIIYWNVYNQAKDSINDWIGNSLKFSKNQELNLWRLDSLVCFNRTGDKCILTIEVQFPKHRDSDHDGIDYFYGVKVKNIWYYFYGPYIVIPRSNYQEDVTTPLPFEKLKLIATKRIYRHYLKKGKNGQWKINDDFFQDLTSVAWCGNCTTQEDWDRKYLLIISENWSKRDTTNNS